MAFFPARPQAKSEILMSLQIIAGDLFVNDVIWVSPSL